MAGPSKPAEKRQVSLTSFFTKTTNGSGPKNRASSPSGGGDGDGNGNDNAPDNAAAAAKLLRKRPLGEDAGGGNGSPDQAAKRAKPSDFSAETAAVKKTGARTIRRVSEDDVPSPEPLVPSRSTRTTRASRYAHGSSALSDRAQLGAEESDEPHEDETVPEKRKKEELHKKFIKKLGHPDSMAHFRTRDSVDENNVLNGEDGADGEGEGEQDEEDEEPPAPVKNSRKKGSKTGKLTPMEIQFLDIKRKHMDTVLIVEVGYKFKFFGEDARVASKEMGIVCIPGKFRYDEHPSEAHLDRFATASIPIHRLPVHAKRLVAAGHKVGVVRQIETAALKKAGDNRNAPFVRKLTNIYTKGTYVDEIGEFDQAGGGGGGGGSSAGYLLCITEDKAKGWGTDEKVNVGIIAVQPTTGDIIYDDFEDGFMRREIETRLLHISPCEFLIVGELTKATDKLVKHLSGTSTNVFGDRSRVERVPRSKTMAAEASSHVTQFYAGKTKSNDERAAALLDKVLKLPELVTICLSAMISHLTEYGLEHIFDLTKYFQSFNTRQHMLLNGTTLESLEVYRNSTDFSETGSLFWAVDKTRTRFGRRQLRKWIGRPLLDEERLEQRLDAVQELLDNQSTAKVDKLESLLSAVKVDLERSLIRIYYGKCTRPELLTTLQVLQRIAIEYSHTKSPSDTGFKSQLLSEAICSLPAVGEIATGYLDRFNAAAARKDDKYAFFRESAETEDIIEHKLGIASVEHDLDTYRKDAAAALGKKVPVTYATVSGIEYLVEVVNADLRRVPASWIKISGTKRVSRFHAPEVVRMLQERDQHREALAAACDDAFTDLLRAIAADYQPLRDAVVALATLDCLASLARVASLPGYSRPTILPAADTPPTVAITAGRHPIAEHTLPQGYIPFTSSLSAAGPGPLAHLITGPNMGGKSSYVRAVALLVILAQCGSFVPAACMRLTLADAVHTRMGARDNLAAGESTFMVEVGETAAILAAATPRSLVVLDELGRGTSTHDGAAIAHAVLDYVVRETRCLTLFITHYQSLARVAAGLGDGLVRCVHMRFTARKVRSSSTNTSRRIKEGGDSDDEEADGEADGEGDEEITFLYEVGDGVAHRSYGLNVARLAHLPRSVIDVAARKSREMERDVRERRLRGAARLLGDVLCRGNNNGSGNNAEDGSSDPLENLMASIEQL